MWLLKGEEVVQLCIGEISNLHVYENLIVTWRLSDYLGVLLYATHMYMYIIMLQYIYCVVHVHVNVSYIVYMYTATQ